MLSVTKEKIDNHFKNNWTLTPIQYEGTKFESPDDRIWISLQTIPYDALMIGYDGQKGRKQTYYTETIRCFNVNPQKAFEVAEAVIDFFDCITIDNLQIGLGIGDGNGAIDLENGTYQVTLNFDIIES